MEEIWKTIPGYNGIYQASNLGRVCREDGKYGKQIRKNHRYILKGEVAHNGYIRYTLCDKKGNKRRFFGHRLVLWAFGFKQNSPRDVVNHIDGNKANNRIDNLEWCSQKENIAHSVKCLGHIPGVGFRKKIICVETGIEFESIHEAGRVLGIEPTNICKMLKGKIKSIGGFHFQYKIEKTY